MKRDFLRELGLEKEAIDSIMAQNGADIEHARDILNSKIESLENQLKDITGKYNEASKKAGDTEALTKRVQELEDSKTKSVEEHSSELKQLRLQHAIETALLSERVKNVKAASALIDIDKITVEGDKIEGLKDQIKSLKDSDDTKFLFENSAGIRGVKPGESTTSSPASPQMSFRDAITKALGKD